MPCTFLCVLVCSRTVWELNIYSLSDFSQKTFLCVLIIQKNTVFSLFVIGNCKNIFRIIKVVFSRGKPVTDMGKSIYHKVEMHSPDELTALLATPVA